MTPEILEEVKAVAANPSAAEKLCGKKGVEYHPVACEVVLKATGQEDVRCRHVTGAIHDARVAAYNAKL